MDELESPPDSPPAAAEGSLAHELAQAGLNFTADALVPTQPRLLREWDSSAEHMTLRETELLKNLKASLHDQSKIQDREESLRSKLAAEAHRAKSAADGRGRAESEVRTLRVELEKLRVEKVAAEEASRLELRRGREKTELANERQAALDERDGELRRVRVEIASAADRADTSEEQLRTERDAGVADREALEGRITFGQQQLSQRELLVQKLRQDLEHEHARARHAAKAAEDDAAAALTRVRRELEQTNTELRTQSSACDAAVALEGVLRVRVADLEQQIGQSEQKLQQNEEATEFANGFVDELRNAVVRFYPKK